MRIAILGTGKIGESLLAGLRSSDWADIIASSRREERAAELRERYGVETTTSNAEAIAGRRRRGARGQAAGHRDAAGRDRPPAHARADGALGRRRDHDSEDRAPPRRRRSGRALDAEHPLDGARRDRRHVRRAPCRARAPRPRRHGAARGRRRRRGPEDQMDAITAVSGSGPGLLRPARRGDDRGRDPARPLARDLDPARRPDDARHREAAARRARAPRRAARDGHLAGRHDDPRDPRARAGRRAGRLPQRDQRRDGAEQGARPRR